METRIEITVHGRAGLEDPYTVADDAGVAVDISASALYFECAAANLRVALGTGTTATNRTIKLTPEQVDTLPLAWVPFIIRDETGAVFDGTGAWLSGTTPVVQAQGLIRRSGSGVTP